MSDDRTLVDRLYSAFSFMTEHPLIEEVRELDRDYWEAQAHINELESDCGTGKFWTTIFLAGVFTVLGVLAAVWIYLLVFYG